MAKGASQVDAALEALYGVPPSEFTSRRDALAKSLEAEGDSEGSAEVRSRKKPTQIAYVLNQLARAHGDEVAELVEVGRALARAQRKALRGEAGHDLRDAITKQRSAVAGLRSRTAALMKELGLDPSGHLDEISGALRSALVDPAVGAQLEGGRLEKVPETAAGFPGASDTPPVDAKTTARTDASAKASASAKEKAKSKARAEEAATAAMAEARERARAADEAEREADGYAAQAKKSRDEASALTAEAKRLAAEAKRVTAEAGRVAREASLARGEAERAGTAAARAGARARSARTAADRSAQSARDATNVRRVRRE